jgi:hypothetical protein
MLEIEAKLRFPDSISLASTKSALLSLLLLTSVPAAGQPAQPAPSFQDRMNDTANALSNEPRLKNVPAERRQALVEFVIGNMLYVAAHEMGHGVIAEMDLPILGREEDAADSFAIVTGIRMGSGFSHRVLVEAAKGWFLSARRASRDGESMDYYDEHGLNQQRAYQIVCMMVGADPEKFNDLAEEAKLPEDRRKTCRRDYGLAAYSWDMVLKPHHRAEGAPKVQINISYGEATGDLTVYARTFRTIRFLESIAEHAAEKFVWKPDPITMEIRTCGDVDGYWSIKDRKLNLCYEMAQEFAQLYRDFGQEPQISKRKR